MDYQLSFSFVQQHSRLIRAKGILTPMDLALGITDKKRLDRLAKSKNGSLEEGIEHIMRLAGFKTMKPASGYIHLNDDSASEYYPENFNPSLWHADAELMQGGREFERRKIYRLDALKRDGTKATIMIKGIKKGYSFRAEDSKNPLTPITRISLFKTSQEEFQLLNYLVKNGVDVERPLGYFSAGIEQWLYTGFVQGINPKDVLESGKQTARNTIWTSDAILLADLCKAGVLHQGFYASEFDDKIYANGKMILIDTDESYKTDIFCKSSYPMPNKHLPLTQRKQHREKFAISRVTECVGAYLSSESMKEDEQQLYIRTFIERSGLPEELEGQILKSIDPNADTTEEQDAVCD